MRDQLAKYIGDLSWEASTSSTTLKLAIDALFETDVAAARDLRAWAEQSGQGLESPYGGR